MSLEANGLGAPQAATSPLERHERRYLQRHASIPYPPPHPYSLLISLILLQLQTFSEEAQAALPLSSQLYGPLAQTAAGALSRCMVLSSVVYS